MHYLVDFDPVFLHLGPIKIHWYGISYLVAFGQFLLLGKYRARHMGWQPEMVSDLLFYGALGVILGGRIGWWLFYNDTPLASDPLLIFRVWEGGMSFHGGLLGVIVAMVWWTHKTNLRFLEVADFVAPLVPLGILAVRVGGNFVGGELWGRLTDSAWGMIFRYSLPDNLANLPHDSLQKLNQAGMLDAYARHPSQLYEALLEGLVTFFVVWLVARKTRKPGVVSGSFLISYGLARFIVEFFREPDANRGFIAFDWMTMGQLLSLPMIVAGLALLVWGLQPPPRQAGIYQSKKVRPESHRQ